MIVIVCVGAMWEWWCVLMTVSVVVCGVRGDACSVIYVDLVIWNVVCVFWGGLL